MGRIWRIVVPVFVFMLSLPDAALAHVTITPDQSPAGDTQVFTLAVPTEKDVPTTGVRLEPPDGFDVVDVQSPPSGWQGNAEDGAVVWSGGEIGTGGADITSPEGEEIQMGQTGEFSFTASVPDKPGDYALAVTQTYKDGSVAEWTGTANSENPAPTIQVIPQSPETTATEEAGHEHGDHEDHHEHTSGTPDPDSGTNPDGTLSPYVLMGAGVLVGAVMIGGLVLLRGRG